MITKKLLLGAASLISLSLPLAGLAVSAEGFNWPIQFNNNTTNNITITGITNGISTPNLLLNLSKNPTILNKSQDTTVNIQAQPNGIYTSAIFNITNVAIKIGTQCGIVLAASANTEGSYSLQSSPSIYQVQTVGGCNFTATGSGGSITLQNNSN